MTAPTVTIGIDLAAQPVRTSVCRVHWHRRHIEVEYIDDGRDDMLIELLAGPAKVGLDCPLGWPAQFVATVSAHHAGMPLPARSESIGLDPLSYRLTDQVTWTSGKLPLSVSTNLLGVVALRGVRLVDRLRQQGVVVDRSGVTGPVAETYPGAAVRAWGLGGPASYKKPAAQPARIAIVTHLEAALGTTLPVAVRSRCVASHDDLDALLCALIARAVELGGTTVPSSVDEWELARVEGWIHVPTGSPADLFVL